ncbi:MAG: glycosyltransferase family 4 protein [Sedimentisphaerales bacterium]|nr:glycosyltransferase family 4 protein [Sedimentisphaerales bacterium]
MLNYEFPPIGGGAANAHLYLLREFAKTTLTTEGTEKSKISIDVLTSAPTPGFFKEQFSDDIAIYKVGIHKKNLHFWRKSEILEWLFKANGRYRMLLKQNTYDLVHAFFGFPTGYLCYRTASQLPYILSLRGSDVPGYNVRLGLDYKILAGLFRRIWRKADAIVANSEGLRELAMKFTPELKIDVIPNGVDTSQFYPSQNKLLSSPVRLLTVCRLISRKRIDLLIAAVAECAKNGVHVQLNIAGEGDLREKLIAFAAECGVADRVNFLLRVTSERMPDSYRDNDIFVISSAHEGMSNAMLEAMASGLPIVTTRCEGVEELIDGNGIVVEDTPASIAAAVTRLINDRQLYAAMAEVSRKRACLFSWSAVAEQYLQYYRTITENRLGK